MFKSDFSKKILKMIGLTVLILLFQTAAIFYLVNFVNKRISETSEKHRLLKITKAERLSSVSLQNDYQKIESYLPVIESILPTEENLYYAVKQIESLGNITGNQATIDITSSNAAFDGNVGSNYVSYRASLSGNYGSFRNYLNELKKSQFLLSIDSIGISGSPSINNQSRMEFNGKIYIK